LRGIGKCDYGLSWFRLSALLALAAAEPNAERKRGEDYGDARHELAEKRRHPLTLATRSTIRDPRSGILASSAALATVHAPPRDPSDAADPVPLRDERDGLELRPLR
jgi:hypothetical protein